VLSEEEGMANIGGMLKGCHSRNENFRFELPQRRLFFQRRATRSAFVKFSVIVVADIIVMLRLTRSGCPGVMEESRMPNAAGVELRGCLVATVLVRSTTYYVVLRSSSSWLESWGRGFFVQPRIPVYK
jgi:hypothetical protein